MTTTDRPPAAAVRLRRVLRGRLVPEVLVMGGYLVLTVALTYPIVWRLADSLPGYPPVDNFHYLWELWYPAHAIFDLHASPFIDAKIYSPFGFDLIRHLDLSPATVLLFMPLTRAVGEVVSYNLIVLMSFPLTAFGTYLLCRELWGSRLAALVAGTAVGFCAYRVSHALGHLSLVNTQWIPFFLFYLERTIRRPTIRNGLLAGLFYSLSALVTWYYAVGCAIAAILYVPVRLTPTDRSHKKDLIRAAAAGALVAIVLVTPFAVPYAKAVTSGAMTDRPTAEQETYSASVADFFIPTASHPLWGRWVRQHWRTGANGQWLSEWQIYLGTVVFGLAILGICAGRTRTAWALMVMGTGMFVVALGPTLQLTHPPAGGLAERASFWPISLPARALALIPPFSLLRAWSRMAFFVEIVVAVLAARGLLVLFDRVPRVLASRTVVWQVAVAAIVLALTIVDTLALPYQTSSVQPRAVDLWLAAQPGDFAIIDYPVIGHGWSGPAMYRRRVNGKRTVLGYGRNPPNEQFWPWLSRYPAPEALDLLQWWDVKYVIVDESRYRSGAEFWGVRHTWKTLETAMLSSGRLAERAVFESVHVYELLDVPDRAVGVELLRNPGFEEREDAVPAEWTRVGDEAIVDTQAHLGKVAVSVTTDNFFVSERIPVTPGRCYQVQQFSRGRHLDDVARLQVNWLDESGRDLGASAALIRVYNTYPSWRGTRAQMRAPATSRAARIFATAHQGQVWLDDYSFRETTDQCGSVSEASEGWSLANRATPLLVAEPNPVPPTIGVGRTTIAWSTGKEPPGPVYVSENGGPEILFAGQSRYGSQDAPWISAGKTYQFRLYSGSGRRRQLSTVIVTARAEPILFATPNPVPPGQGAGKTEIQWNTGDGSVGEIHVSIDDRPEILFARNVQGSQEAAWIADGSTYVFRLYKVGRERTLLFSITVRRGTS